MITEQAMFTAKAVLLRRKIRKIYFKRNMAQTLRTQKDQYNMTFCILSALTIIMVVAGHCGYHILTVGELFPYYSFHVPLFMFISGYFYKDSEQEKPLNYVKKKLLRLIVPYLIWNLVYGVISWAMRAAGFAMGEGIGFKTLFIEPFLHGYQFIYNYAAWFVPVLFIVEVMNLYARVILRWVVREVWHLYRKMLPQMSKSRSESGNFGEFDNLSESGNPGGNTSFGNLNKETETDITEWIMMIGSLLVGITVIWLAISGHVWGNYKAPGRILLLFPCFQMGQFYLKKLEKHDTLGNTAYFAVLIGVQVILNIGFNGLAFSSVWCTGFANGAVMPYVTTVSGIAFWLRVSKILTPALEKSRSVQYLGRNTYAVMMHHVMAFMVVKIVIALVAANTGYCADFDFEQFYTNIDYFYMVRGREQFAMVYLAAGVLMPLGVQCGLDRVKNFFWRMRCIGH